MTSKIHLIGLPFSLLRERDVCKVGIQGDVPISLHIQDLYIV